MGYTHYFRWTPQRGRASAYAAAANDCLRILAAWKAEHTQTGTGSRIGFQTKDGWTGVFGKAESFHFPMTLSAMKTARSESDFCKTNRHGYDSVVVACLCVLAESGCVDVASDGESDDWEDGRTYAESILSRPVALPVGVIIRPDDAPLADKAESPAAAPAPESDLVSYWRARALAAERLAGIGES